MNFNLISNSHAIQRYLGYAPLDWSNTDISEEQSASIFGVDLSSMIPQNTRAQRPHGAASYKTLSYIAIKITNPIRVPGSHMQL